MVQFQAYFQIFYDYANRYYKKRYLEIFETKEIFHFTSTSHYELSAHSTA